ncbi:hypothetical protein SAMN02799624_03156 [Paenibacillus sp. UNC496MF]|uniref:hypothetical protein n=1 Tax=Paenibacillus sp. UNC496MF TaxID=1502753 RepID=UPI0008E88891|nr:hypothetical protein [Paenibacillus sp. UNC496MF]SFJ04509.1 hypothetical protein SAMN02799624_03156 [Paenibacillus sp. UNC496MF]
MYFCLKCQRLHERAVPGVAMTSGFVYRDRTLVPAGICSEPPAIAAKDGEDKRPLEGAGLILA